MLKFYRKNIKLFIWLIVLSFIIWGAGSISVSRQSVFSYIGSVKGEKISQKEFLTTMRYYDLLVRTQAAREKTSSNQNQTEKTPESETLSVNQLQALTWQAIVLSREAKQEGIHVNDEEVRNEIEKLFSGSAGFNEEFYQTWIHTNFRGQARDFEEAVRKHIAVQKMRQKVLEGIPEKEREARWLEWLKPVIIHANVRDFTAQKPETAE